MAFQENGSFLEIFKIFNFLEILKFLWNDGHMTQFNVTLYQLIYKLMICDISWYKILFCDLEIINQHVNIWKRNLLRTYHAP